jgi:hypothetical protein
MGMGLLFTTADPEELRLLGTWLNELGGGKQRERSAPAQMPADAAKDNDHTLRDIVSDLISVLVRKSVVNDSEGKAMLRKLSG